MIDVSISSVRTIDRLLLVLPAILEKIKLLLTKIQVDQCNYMRDDQIATVAGGAGSVTVTYKQAFPYDPIVIATVQDEAVGANPAIAWISAISTTAVTISVIDYITGAAPVGATYIHVIIRERVL